MRGGVDALDVQTGLRKRDGERQADVTKADDGHAGVLRHGGKDSGGCPEGADAADPRILGAMQIEPSPERASDPPPVLSVLIPCWNAATTIAAALRSVLEADAVPLEVVVVDDASTDITPEIVAAIAERDPRVVLVRQPANGGVSAARNRGLEVVRGEWLAFLDADDRWLPGGLDALATHARDSDALAVLGQRVWTDGRATWISNDAIPDVRLAGRKSLATHPGLVYYAAIHGKVLHRSTWEGTSFEGRVLGDQPWTIGALLRAGDRIDVLPDLVYEWHRPRTDTAAGGITAASRSSARQGAVAAGAATRAFASVCADADRWVRDDEARQRVVATYLERLMHADLGGYVRRALDRRDPTLPELLTANGAFLDTVPPALLATSAGVRRHLLVPPLHHWPWLAADARAAWATMAEPVFRADPALERTLAGERAGRLSVHVRTSRDRAAYLAGRARLALRQRLRRGRWPG